MLKTCASALLLVPASASSFGASTVCIYNDAGFVMKFKLRDTEQNVETEETKHYPILQTRCLEVAALEGVKSGATVVPVVQAFWGKELVLDAVQYDSVNAAPVTYVCRGTTLNYKCQQETPPPSAKEIAKDIGMFLLGFTEGLGEELGFGDCLKDINSTYADLAEVVGFFENGINKQLPGYVEKAFTKIGKLLKDFSVAITACVKDASAFVQKFEDLAAALTGNVLDVVKIIVEEGIHIFRERKDLTADCKAVASDWQAGDYEGSGHAVGDIVGILLAGLEQTEAQGTCADDSCDAGVTCCEVGDKFECCTGGESCIPKVGCRCREGEPCWFQTQMEAQGACADDSCDAGVTCCEIGDKFECCTGGESCIPKVGCRCREGEPCSSDVVV